MTTAAKFQTDILYPGGYGKCGIGTHDPYPGGIPDGNIFKITKNIEDIWPLIWNLEGWSVSLDGIISLTENAIGYSGTRAFGVDADVSGQFHSCIGGIGLDGGSPLTDIGAFVYNGKPHERVCGSGRSVTKLDTTTNQLDATQRLILPRVDFGPFEFGDEDDTTSRSDSVNIEDDSSTVVGDCSFTRTSYGAGFYGVLGHWRLAVTPTFIRLTGATCDVYFQVEAYSSTFSSEGGGDPSAILVNNNTTAPTYIHVGSDLSTGASTQAVTATLLGETVNGFLWYKGTVVWGDTADLTFNSFSLTYAVTPTTLYTY